MTRRKILNTLIVIGMILFAIWAVIPADENTCYLCGNNEDGYMSIYRGRNSVGVWNLNTGVIMDISILEFDDSGRTTGFNQSQGMQIANMGEGYGMILLRNEPTDKSCHVDIQLEEKNKNNNLAYQKTLCSRCSERIAEISRIYQNKYISDTYLIDFKTAKIYPMIGDESYSIGDYLIHIRMEKNRIEAVVKYQPMVPEVP